MPDGAAWSPSAQPRRQLDGLHTVVKSREMVERCWFNESGSASMGPGMVMKG